MHLLKEIESSGCQIHRNCVDSMHAYPVHAPVCSLLHNEYRGQFAYYWLTVQKEKNVKVI